MAKNATPLRMLLVVLLAGLATGVLGGAYYLLVVVLIGRRALMASFNPGVIMALPTIGLFLGGLILTYLAKGDGEIGEDIVLGARNSDGRIGLSFGTWKLFSSVPTISLGGSAGISGPLILAGAVIAQAIYRALHLSEEDSEMLRVVLLAGVVAGFAAAFRAPIAAIVFAFEFPIVKPVSWRPALSAAVAAFAAYSTFSLIVGWSPLLATRIPNAMKPSVLLGAVVIGVACGIGGRLFSGFYRAVREWFESGLVNRHVKTLIGGAVVGFTGFFGLLPTGAPYLLGVGYQSMRASLEAAYNPLVFVALVFLKFITTAATIGSGAFGGFIEPLLLMGSSTGASLSWMAPTGGVALAASGLAGFFSAGYRAPFTAALLVAELTGSPVIVIPALITALVASLIAGSRSRVYGLNSHGPSFGPGR